MKRWLPWFSLPVLTCIGILFNRATAPYLLTDTDTAVLLRALHARQNPLSWFWTDWPLQNHFYRPVSTLFFELDNALHPNDPAGFGLTNALLAVGCVLLLFWVVRELSEKPWLAGLSAGLFGVWHLSPSAVSFLDPVCWTLAAGSLLFLAQGFRQKILTVFLVGLALVYLSTVWQPVSSFNDRVVNWLPGRTASTMVVFALASVASYCRFERLSAGRLPLQAPTPLDLPATKNTEMAPASVSQSVWIWFGLAVLFEVLALGCYEQAVMLPGLLLGCAVMFQTGGRRPHWWTHFVYWVVLLVYVFVRAKFVPSAPSGYQEQQFRTGPGVIIAITDYVFPAWSWFKALMTTMSSGLVLLVTASPWVMGAFGAGNVASWRVAWKDPMHWQVLGWFLLAVFAFLPMAWLQPFGHYHYWPSAFRAVYVIGLAATTLRAWTNAAARPALQAPPRQRPAPGSLLHP